MKFQNLLLCKEAWLLDLKFIFLLADKSFELLVTFECGHGRMAVDRKIGVFNVTLYELT
jgi:hypothetical protein